MPNHTSADSAPISGVASGVASGLPSGMPAHLQERLAEAACYAVRSRLAPVLRHDVAGFMQPVGLLMMVLQRRVQAPEPDMQDIIKNMTSLSALAKESTTGCMNAIGWIASRENPSVNLRNSVDEAAALLAMDLFISELEIENALPDDAAVIPQRVFRSVLIGALLAFCDQRTAGGVLQISLETGSDLHLMLRMLPGSAARTQSPPDAVPRSRDIAWEDVEAMAQSLGVAMARGEGWLALGLPNAGRASLTR